MTQEAEYTPGPWVHYDDSADGKTNRHEIAAFGKTICHIYHSVPEQDKANARLIAAAPELLEALELMLKPAIKCLEANGATKANNGVTLTYSVRQIENYRAAIAKARGQS